MGQCQSANAAMLIQNVERVHSLKESKMTTKTSYHDDDDGHADLSTTRCGSSHFMAFGDDLEEQDPTPAPFGSTSPSEEENTTTHKEKRRGARRGRRRNKNTTTMTTSSPDRTFSSSSSTSCETSGTTTTPLRRCNSKDVWAETPSVALSLSDKLSSAREQTDYSWSLLCTDSDSSNEDLEDYSSNSDQPQRRRRRSIDSIIVEEASWGGLDLTETQDMDLLHL